MKALTILSQVARIKIWCVVMMRVDAAWCNVPVLGSEPVANKTGVHRVLKNWNGGVLLAVHCLWRRSIAKDLILQSVTDLQEERERAQGRQSSNFCLRELHGYALSCIGKQEGETSKSISFGRTYVETHEA